MICSRDSTEHGPAMTTGRDPPIDTWPTSIDVSAARVSLDADVTEGVKAKFRLASGSSDPVSSNQTLDGGFSSATGPVHVGLLASQV